MNKLHEILEPYAKILDLAIQNKYNRTQVHLTVTSETKVDEKMALSHLFNIYYNNLRRWGCIETNRRIVEITPEGKRFRECLEEIGI